MSKKVLIGLAISAIACGAVNAEAGYRISQVTTDPVAKAYAWLGDTGHIGWTSNNEVFSYDDDADQITQVTVNNRYDTIRGTNSRGDLLVHSYIPGCPSGGTNHCEFAYQLYEASSGDLIDLTIPGNSGVQVDDGQINNNGDFAVTRGNWSSYAMTFSSSPDYALNQVSETTYLNYHPDMNNNGDVAWSGPGTGGGYYLFKYNNSTGMTERVTQLTTWSGSQTINDNGDIVFFNSTVAGPGVSYYTAASDTVDNLSSIITGVSSTGHGYKGLNNNGYIAGKTGSYPYTTRLLNTATGTYADFPNAIHPYLTDDSLIMKINGAVTVYDIAAGTSSVVVASNTAAYPKVNSIGDVVYTDTVAGVSQVFKAEFMEMSIAVTKASYDADSLHIQATSDHGTEALLEVVGFGPMEWNAKKGHWELKLENVAEVGQTITVAGDEGSATVPVDFNN